MIVLDVPSNLKLLRTNLGELGQRYFDALNLQKAIDLQTAFTKLESAWVGKDNVFLSRYRFCQMRQESSQCVGDFITNLTLAIQDCGYKEIKADNFEHAMLVQQLIVGLRDEKARENLLSEKNSCIMPLTECAQSTLLAEPSVFVIYKLSGRIAFASSSAGPEAGSNRSHLDFYRLETGFLFATFI
nr:unnamed protein product [Spirometra erinaceieuropaei]